MKKVFIPVLVGALFGTAFEALRHKAESRQTQPFDDYMQKLELRVEALEAAERLRVEWKEPELPETK